MNKLYSTLLLVLCGLVVPAGAQVLENFEGATRTLNFGGDGVFAVVKNPDSTNTINRSTNVGRYVKDSTKAFSLLIADLPSATTLTAANNQLFVDIRATQDTRVIAKMEGTGPAVEVTLNIPVSNQWRRYRFDLSAATAASSFTKIIFFFDAGNAAGKATYFFDNIRLGSDPCAGTVRDLSIVDDFDCQRQLPLRVGLDSLTVVDNPDPDAVNGAGKVGRYADPPGDFAALVYNFDRPIDIAARPVVRLKYWAPRANRLLIKLEGGTSPGREIGVDVTATNEWREYSFDFSAFAGDNFRSLTIFANAGQNAPGVVYYFDDIRFAAKEVNFLETFDRTEQTVFVQPRGNNTALNGTFRVIDNPYRTGLNTTPRVGEHVKGSSALSTLSIQTATALDLTTTPQLNMLIWAPAGSRSIRVSALSASRGRRDVTREITATEEWIAVSFNFPDLATATDVSEFEVVFDPTITGTRTYYFDQLSLGESSVDPCEGVAPVANLIDNFECQRNVPITGGAALLKVVNNPDKTAPNTSDKVGEFTHDNSQFANIVYNFGANAPDLAVFNNFVADIWSPKMTNIAFKLEGSTNGSPAKEIVVPVTAVNSWQTYRVSFGDVADGKYERLVIFFDFNNPAATGNSKYYIDNVRRARGPVNGCVTNFETPNTTIADWRGFAGGNANDTAFAVVNNPDRSGINTSARVGRFTESSDMAAGTFAGIFAPLGAPIVFPDPANKTVRVKVWAPDTARFVLKMEQGVGGTQTGDIFPVAPYTTKGQWQELTFDYSAFDTEAARFTQFTLIPGFGFRPAATRQVYFDDIVIGSAMCVTSSTREERRAITDLRAYPNPTSGQLFVEAPASTERLQLFDALGRQVANLAINVGVDGGLAELDVHAQAAGFYTVVALDRTGVALARVRVAVTD